MDRTIDNETRHDT